MDRGFVVTVARNNLHLTKKAVASALAQDIPCDVLLVDNASSDGTAQWAATKHLTRISMLQQTSLAECWNIGLAAAWSVGREGVLVCNNDVEIRPETVRYLSSYSLHQKVPFVTCVSVNAPQQFVEPALHWSDHTREHPDFSCFYITKEVTDKVGWFNEEYFPAYCEDSEYHIRMHRAGIKAVCTDLPFLHHGAATVKHCDPAERSKIQRGADRNRERFRAVYGCLPGTPAYYALFGQ